MSLNNGTASLSALCLREGPHDTVLYIVVALWALGLVKTNYVKESSHIAIVSHP